MDQGSPREWNNVSVPQLADVRLIKRLIMNAQIDIDTDLDTKVDAATDMMPLPQPAKPTPTQEVLDDLPDYRHFIERAIVEI